LNEQLKQAGFQEIKPRGSWVLKGLTNL